MQIFRLLRLQQHFYFMHSLNAGLAMTQPKNIVLNLILGKNGRDLILYG